MCPALAVRDGRGNRVDNQSRCKAGAMKLVDNRLDAAARRHLSFVLPEGASSI